MLHEALIKTAFAGRDATITCPYDMLPLSPHAISDAYRTHPVLQQAGKPLGEFHLHRYPLRPATEFNQPLPAPTAHAAFAFATATDLQAVRGFVTTHAVAAGADTGQLDRMLVAVGELTANTICHTDGGGVVRVWRDGDALVCQVEDSGHLADVMVGRIPQPRDQARGGACCWSTPCVTWSVATATPVPPWCRSMSASTGHHTVRTTRCGRSTWRLRQRPMNPPPRWVVVRGGGMSRQAVDALGRLQAELTTGSPGRDCR